MGYVSAFVEQDEAVRVIGLVMLRFPSVLATGKSGAELDGTWATLQEPGWRIISKIRWLACV